MRLRLLRGLLHQRLLLSRFRAGAGLRPRRIMRPQERSPVIIEKEEILKALRAGPTILERLIRSLDDEVVRARPAPGEWAIVEVVAHLADTEERALARTRAMLEEEEPALPAYDPAALAEERNYIAMALGGEIERFRALRGEQARLLGSLTDGQWQRSGTHEEHGRITVQQLAAHTAGEDADHFVQIARLIPG
ncbi:MAG TPA: DinB family protein [Candidatus Limnocylindria bacterium]